MNVLSLFSGIGGLDLAAESAGMQTVAFCERDKFCQKVLAKHWPSVPCFDDITTLKASDIHVPVDIIAGGYPCQPFSVAGRRKGKDDDRYLWPEFSRLIDELRPSWVVGENVAGHITNGLDAVCDDLESKNYAVQTYVFPASAVGALHKRDRCFIVAHALREGLQIPRQKQNGENGRKARRSAAASGWWSVEPDVDRVAHGVRGRMDRLKSLGNAVVPQQAYPIFKAIMDIELMMFRRGRA